MSSIFDKGKSNPYLFSESLIDDAIKHGKVQDEALKKVADTAETINKTVSSQEVNTTSIIARARKSILQFPIYTTQSIPVNEAQIIAKLFERVYTTLVQTVLAQNPIISEEEANDLVFLRNFHTNLKESADIEIQSFKESYVNEFYQPIDELDEMLQEATFFQTQLSPTCTVMFRAIPTTNKDLIAENARLIHEPLSGLRYLQEDSRTTLDKVPMSEEELREIAKDRAHLSRKETEYVDKTVREIKDMLNGNQSEIDNAIDFKRSGEAKIQRALNQLKKDIKDGNITGYSYDGVKYYRTRKSKVSSIKDGEGSAPPVDAPRLLRDTDVKKINGMLPYSIEATFRIRGKDGKPDRDVRYVLGIKSVMHLIRVQDLVEDLRDLVTGNIKSLRKVRYKTGEIGFMDYLFNVKQIKKDAAKSINYNKKWVNTLKRLAEYDKMNGALLKTPAKLLSNGKVPIPNGTLILTQADVTTLKNQTGIDLSVVENAKRLSKSLFLIAVAIVDPSAGTMKVLFPDSDSSWDVQSLASIDAEVSKSDNSSLLKELNKKINTI